MKNFKKAHRRLCTVMGIADFYKNGLPILRLMPRHNYVSLKEFIRNMPPEKFWMMKPGPKARAIYGTDSK